MIRLWVFKALDAKAAEKDKMKLNIPFLLLGRPRIIFHYVRRHIYRQ